MTPKEAITTLKLMQAQIEWDYPMDYAAAIDMAISALERQIPKQPDYISNGYSPEGVAVWDAYCPNCEYELDEETICPKCGQVIDWEVAEDDDKCYECTAYGDDYYYNEEKGEYVRACDECPYNERRTE